MIGEEVSSVESEAGIIATLIYHPDYIFYSEQLHGNHFTNPSNRCVYEAISGLVQKGVYTVDPYNIIQYISSADEMANIAKDISLDKLNDLIDNSDAIARHTVEEYQMLVSNVMDAAFRNDTIRVLNNCIKECRNTSIDNIGQYVYKEIDEVMMNYSSTQEVPQYKDVIDDCWEEIKSRQKDGYAGIPFKFKTLNEYATIEPGELFIFAAEAKQGKSMMLLDCAIDLLRQDKAVLYIDSELNTRLFTARVLAYLSGIEYRNLTCGAYDEEGAKRIERAREWMKTRKFTHLYIPMFDQQTIYSAVKKVKNTQGLDVLIVDYFKGSGNGDAFDSYQELGRFVDMVKNKICGEMGICGLGAAQATANGKVADSAKIGRNASTIAMIQDKTLEEIEADGPECGNKKLRVVLNRNGMQHAEGEYIDLRFDGNHISYEEAKQHVPQQPY